VAECCRCYDSSGEADADWSEAADVFSVVGIEERLHRDVSALVPQ
jgi:hypothetical protein